MSSFQHSKWSDNKRCTVEVGWGIFIENTTIFFFVPNSGRKYSIKNSPWLLFRKMIISQLELGLPGYIENLDLTNLRKNNQIVRYVKGWLIILFLIIIFFVEWRRVTQHFGIGTVTVDDICALMSIRSYSYSSYLFVIPGYIISLDFWIAFVINRISLYRGSLYRGCFPYILL